MLRIAVPIVLIAWSVAAEPEKPEKPEHLVKRLVDRHRAAVGLPAVELDPKLGQGCMEHAEYMRLNRNTEAMVGLNAHRQRPNLPGATRAGAACAKRANLFPGVSDFEAAVDGWMAGLYHRRPILAPPLGKIGVGYSKLPDGSYMAALMFVDGNDPRDATWPIAYPANQQTAVPLDFANEVPNPIPGRGRAGYPITLQFPPFDKVTGVKATLSAHGKDVPVHLSSPERPATSFGQYGVVCLIPKLPLSPQTRYDVHVEAVWKGKPVSQRWSFTTLALRPVDAHDEAAVEQALNVASTLRGTTGYAGWVNGELAFLQIGARKLSRYKMISVLIPKAVWHQLGGAAALAGKTIEVDGTPHLVEGKFINVPITIASQIRIVR
jgi:hypothetical protein